MLTVATWMARLTPVTLAVVGALLLALVAVAWFNPEPPAQQQSELARLQAEHVQQERRLLAQAKAAPPTGRINLNFEKLSFYLPPGIQHSVWDGKGYGAYLPTGIKSYDGREVRIQGYMLPTKLEHGLVKECLVLANQMTCCFGQEPRFCQFIAARIDGPGVPDLMDQPLRFEGKLRVGDVFENGVWAAVYSMNCTTVTP
ncbi:hypothetical protein [Opitutus sp. GAS368]|uniref:hypothetical protein n=1 Tax=Opitutus sp. GAS368 TaxID=1882749 RepID=UPI00087CB4F7|nr:hypothetical protein [Opitutus sp. GAS368]SDS32621.1 hypothetical protein SAMN05444173_2557 [Opitutus sp. GAS368]